MDEGKEGRAGGPNASAGRFSFVTISWRTLVHPGAVSALNSCLSFSSQRDISCMRLRFSDF